MYPLPSEKGEVLLRGGGQPPTILSLLLSLLPFVSLMWSEVSSLQFSYWLGQAGIVHIGLDQRVLTADSEIREKKYYHLCHLFELTAIAINL